MEDISALVLEDHAEFRRGFAYLDDARTTEQIRAVWQQLARHLEVHAEAEEEIFYPYLLKASEQAEDETDDAIRDHNKIRDAIDEAARHPVASGEWWAAVWRARHENSEHLMEEEDGVLPDFRKHATFDLRADLGARWITFYAEHPNGKGLLFRDKDPKEYIQQHKSSAPNPG